MIFVSKQLDTWHQKLCELLDSAPAMGGSFLTSAVRDTTVRHFYEFAGTEILPYIAYQASNVCVDVFAKRFSFIRTTLQQLSGGLLLGLMDLGDVEEIALAIAMGCIRGIRRIIQTKNIDVPHTYREDVLEGLLSSIPDTVELNRLGRLVSKYCITMPVIQTPLDVGAHV